MKLACPVCSEKPRLDLSKDDDGLLTHRCRKCRGQWLAWDDYHPWLQCRAESLPEIESDDDVPAAEAMSVARLCPACGVILSRYRIGHGMSFQLDFCGRCNGVWFDRDEWEAVRARNLHGKVNHFFTTGWQRAVRERERVQHREQLLRRRLGDENFQRVIEFRNWLRGQKAGAAVIAFLGDESEYASHPKVVSGALRQWRR